MNEKETLHKAVEIAANNGWVQKVIYFNTDYWDPAAQYSRNHIPDIFVEVENPYYNADDPTSGEVLCIFIHNFIYEHGFLRAFFGERSYSGWTCEIAEYEWQYHACQMQLSTDPIQYITSYLEETSQNS